MCFLGQFNRLVVWNFPIIDCGSACIVFRKLTRYWVTRNRFNITLLNLMVQGIVFNKFKVCIYQVNIWRWLIGGLFFVKWLASLFVPLSQYTLSFSITSLSINQCHLISHVFWTFWFHARVYKSFCCRIFRFEGCRFVVQWDQWWSHVNSCFLVVEGSTCFSLSCWRYDIANFLHYVCIGPFILRLGFIGLGEGQSLKWAGTVHQCGAYWGIFGLGYWSLSSAFFTYSGIDMSTYSSL